MNHASLFEVVFMEEGPLTNGLLPDELVLRISEHLPFTAQFELGRTCRKLNAFIKDKFLWQKRIKDLLPLLGYEREVLPTQANFVHLLNNIHHRFLQEVAFLESAFPKLAAFNQDHPEQWIALDVEIKKVKRILHDINEINYLEQLNVVDDLLNKLNLTIIQWQLPVAHGAPQYGNFLKFEHITRLPKTALEVFNAYFTPLKRLELKGNFLCTLPANIDICLALESLNAYDNPICHIPSSLAQLAQLKYLYFSGGVISKMPSVIYGLKSLQWLSFDNMQLKYISDNINQLQNLTWLYLRNNKLAFLPLGLCELPKLNTFMCDDNDIYPLQHINILAFLRKHNVEVQRKKKRAALTHSGSIDLLGQQMQLLSVTPQFSAQRYLNYNNKTASKNKRGATLARNFSFF